MRDVQAAQWHTQAVLSHTVLAVCRQVLQLSATPCQGLLALLGRMESKD